MSALIMPYFSRKKLFYIIYHNVKLFIQKKVRFFTIIAAQFICEYG